MIDIGHKSLPIIIGPYVHLCTYKGTIELMSQNKKLIFKLSTLGLMLSEIILQLGGVLYIFRRFPKYVIGLIG